MILIVVLWAVSLMTLSVVALSAISQKSLSLAGAETDRLRSELALEAGLALAYATIVAEAPENRVYFNGQPVKVDTGEGRIAEIAIRDASGLIDLNRAEPVLIEQFMKKNAADPTAAGILIEAIAALRPVPKPGAGQDTSSADGDQRSQATQQQGNRTTSGQPGAGPGEKGTRPQPVAIAATGQLYGLEKVPDTVLDKLLPLITLYSSQGGKVNPMAAPRDVLLSIPGLGDREAGIFETARKRRQWQTPEVQSAINALEKFIAVGEARSFVISVKLVEGPGLIAGSSLTSTVVADENSGQAFQAMAWSW
jgi:type II secretory pathway component PulK